MHCFRMVDERVEKRRQDSWSVECNLVLRDSAGIISSCFHLSFAGVAGRWAVAFSFASFFCFALVWPALNPFPHHMILPDFWRAWFTCHQTFWGQCFLIWYWKHFVFVFPSDYKEVMALHSRYSSCYYLLWTMVWHLCTFSSWKPLVIVYFFPMIQLA